MAGLSKPQICEEYLRKQSLRMVLAPKRYPFLAARLSWHMAHVTTNLQVKREQQSVLDNGAHICQGKLIRQRGAASAGRRRGCPQRHRQVRNGDVAHGGRRCHPQTQVLTVGFVDGVETEVPFQTLEVILCYFLFV